MSIVFSGYLVRNVGFWENRNGHHEFPLSDFLGQIGSEPVPKEEGEPFDMRLVSVDRTASIAIAKVEVRYEHRRYTDYLMLQKIGDEWKVFSKAFFCADCSSAKLLLMLWTAPPPASRCAKVR